MLTGQQSHSKVDGHTIGQDPLVTRMPKGVYNERPPLPRYSSFWDLEAVLRYIQNWGRNDNLKLWALTRPARIMDLSKLDIGSCCFKTSGVLLKPQLSKQSRPSKPLADFFYPRYTEDESCCHITGL